MKIADACIGLQWKVELRWRRAFPPQFIGRLRLFARLSPIGPPRAPSSLALFAARKLARRQSQGESSRLGSIVSEVVHRRAFRRRQVREVGQVVQASGWSDFFARREARSEKREASKRTSERANRRAGEQTAVGGRYAVAIFPSPGLAGPAGRDGASARFSPTPGRRIRTGSKGTG